MAKPKSDLMEAPYPDLPAFPARRFRWREVACKHCGGFPPRRFFNYSAWKHSINLASRLRTELGRPLIASSWYRCGDHPLERSKSNPGAHTYLAAVDFLSYGNDAYAIVNEAMIYSDERELYIGIGLRQKGPTASRFVHIDFVDLVGVKHYEGLRPWIWTY